MRTVSPPTLISSRREVWTSTPKVWSVSPSYSQAPMRSTPAKFRLPLALEESAKARCKEAGYANLSEYILGLLRYDLLTRRPHETTAALSKLGRAEQDKIDDEIATMFKSGESLGGSWFENRLQEAVAAAGAPEPTRSKLVQELLTRLKGRK